LIDLGYKKNYYHPAYKCGYLPIPPLYPGGQAAVIAALQREKIEVRVPGRGGIP